MLRACGNPAVRVVLWDGAAIESSDSASVGDIVILKRAALRSLLIDPELAFGDCYSDGLIAIDGPIVAVLSTIWEGLNRNPSHGLMWRLARALLRRRSHSVAASRECIQHHYDIGNDFYRLWLDDRMQYSCAYYSQPDFTLEEAQLAKLDHVCRKLRLRFGDRVVEAGCGWGGLALHMAEKYGASVRAFNVSREQVDFARDQVRSKGLEGRVEIIEDDYRNMTGTYDAFVSVGMLEHVGPENYAALGRVIDRVLTSAGRGLIHAIGRNRPAPLDPWTDKRIFPGAYPPSLREMLGVLEPVGFSVLDVENLRLHYARTLENWLERFEQSSDTIAEMFDERFVRMWRMYLAGSLATFNVGGLQLFQTLFVREANNDLPWTRGHLYAGTSQRG